MSITSLVCRDLAARRLLSAHVLTKFGSKAWEFATPLLLLHLSPFEDDMSAPAIFGLAVFSLKFFIGPITGRWMDGTARLTVVNTGIALQALGVLGAVVVLCLSPSISTWWPVLLAMVVCGVVECIGALVSSVTVEKDWVPTLYSADATELTTINAAMANIDLISEMVGPLAAGAALDLLGGTLGFGIVGIVNLVTFGAELALLRSAYFAREPLRVPKAVTTDGAGGGSGGGLGKAIRAVLHSWIVFFSHPSGIPYLVTSYSLLYFTVLSPHDVVLAAFLNIRDLNPTALAAFRAAGALSGVVGMEAFRVLTPRVGLRRLGTIFLWLLAVAVTAAAISFYATHASLGLSTPMIAFLSLLVVSRFGLYGFDLANLQLQQLHVDEAHRGAVGSVEESLCSLGTASVFVGALAAGGWTDALVYLSACFVGAGALVYTTWVLLYREHEHSHADMEHMHTTQQKESLKETTNNTHAHLHLRLPWAPSTHSLRHRADGDAAGGVTQTRAHGALVETARSQEVIAYDMRPNDAAAAAGIERA